MITVALHVLLIGWLAVGATAQPRGPRIDFLNERQRVPESERFVESDYIESGVGLRFGIDKRLSYFPGQYEEAALAFAQAIQTYRFKADIWVFLARSYFYMRDPQRAKKTLEQAALIMPDLRERFWDPLLNSMLGEIRKRAIHLQTQVDFYTKAQGDFLTLFRLYKFLEDYEAGIGVIHTAGDKADMMRMLADMASVENQRTYRREATKWDDLAALLTGELDVLGIIVPPRAAKKFAAPALPVVTQDPQLVDDTRVLQMKVDFYQSESQDYRQLFDNYLVLEMPEGAARVIEAIDREMNRLRFLADTATDFVQESEYLAEASTLAAMREELKAEMGGGP